MPPRKQLTEGEIKEIQNLRGLMSAKDIQKKYGIGAPRLYKIWRESKLLTDNAAQSILQNTNSAPLTIQKNSDVDSILQNTNSATNSILQNIDRVLPVQSNIGEQLLFRIQNILQNIDTTLQNINGKIIETQEEVESVASDVEDIEDKVEDLETNTSIVDLSRKIYVAIEAAKNIMFYGPIAAGGIGIIAYTLKYVHRNKTDEFDFDSKPVNTQHI